MDQNHNPMEPNPEIAPTPSPQINPQKNAPEITPGRIDSPEIFPQHSPDATPPLPGQPDIIPDPGIRPPGLPDVA